MKALIYTLRGLLTREIQQHFSQLKKIIAERPVYVMFEPLLNCNPLTDHQSPKNILPIFQDDINRTVDELVEQSGEMVKEQII